MPLHSEDASQGPARKGTARPRFEDYSIKESWAGKPARIVWPSGMDSGDAENEKFIDSVKGVVAYGPNFAGHYSIAHWGLGTDVSSIAVVDLITGKVFKEMPFVFLHIPWDPERKSPYRGFLFRASSRLLIVSGCIYKGESQKHEDCGWKYYKWEQDHFALVSAVPGPVPPGARFRTRPKE